MVIINSDDFTVSPSFFLCESAYSYKVIKCLYYYFVFVLLYYLLLLLFRSFTVRIQVNDLMFLQVLLLMSTALNLPINEASAPTALGADLTTDVRSRQQRIAEITEMIHVSPSEIFS